MERYILLNGKLGLRKTNENDLDYVLATETDPENRLYVGQWNPSKHKESFVDEDIMHLIIENSITRKPVGYVIIAGLKNINKALELTRIVISEKGYGYGKETISLIKKLTFEILNFNRLWLDVRLNNPRAQHVYKSSGFIEEGIVREAILIDGNYESLMLLSILSSEYDSYSELS